MSSQAVPAASALTRYRWPGSALARFVARRTLRGSLLWSVIFGVYVAASAIGFVTAYPTQAAREQLAQTLGTNVGLEALFGIPHQIDTAAGFTAWRSLGIVTIGAAIWAVLTATGVFRGEEEAGRWELFLAGQTTARRAAANALAGLGIGLLAMYAVVASITVAVGQSHGLHFGVGACLFHALALMTSAAEFLALGALMSQLAATRGQAAGLSTGVFGISFLLKVIADVDRSVQWLLTITPLGWVENLHPLTNRRPLWLVPIGAFTAIACALAIDLAGRRDLGASILADRDAAEPHTALLGTPFGVAVRQNRTLIVSWLSGLVAAGLVYGALTKTAAQAFADSPAFSNFVGRLASGQAQRTGALTFLGIVFLLVMVAMMVIVANLIGTIRGDEAEGYLDNLLVRPVGRVQWLAGRLLIVVAAACLASILTSLASWATARNAGVSLPMLLSAGVNALAPAALLIGIGVLVFGFVPRLTSAAMYGVIAWSFLLEMIGSTIDLNRWVRATSLLHHVAVAPAVDPDWGRALAMVGVGAALVVAGFIGFRTRDLVTE